MNIIDRINNKLKYNFGEQLKPGIFYTCIIESLYQCIMEDVRQLVDNMSTTEKQLVGNSDELKGEVQNDI